MKVSPEADHVPFFHEQILQSSVRELHEKKENVIKDALLKYIIN